MIYIQHDTTNDKQVQKVGGLNRANRMVKIEGQKRAVEAEFMSIAIDHRKRSTRATQQRERRRAKRQ